MERSKEENFMLIASFIPKINLDWVKMYLKEKFKINQENVFVYEIDGDNCDYLITFKLKRDKRIDLKFHFKNATIVNNKCGCIFSINGLKRLIEMKTGCEIGNVNYDNYKVNWLEYKNNLVLSNKNNLSIKKINKISV